MMSFRSCLLGIVALLMLFVWLPFNGISTAGAERQVNWSLEEASEGAAPAFQVSSDEGASDIASGLRNRAHASDSSVQQAATLLKQAQRCACGPALLDMSHSELFSTDCPDCMLCQGGCCIPKAEQYHSSGPLPACHGCPCGASF